MTQFIEIPNADDSKIAVPNIEFNDQKVMTTELLAQLFDCSVKNIHDNFANHKSQFELGFDYFNLQNADLKDFKNQYVNLTTPILSGQFIVSKNARNLILWTKYGAILLSKIINTPQAWAMQKRLIQFYFDAQDAKKEDAQSQEYSEKSYRKSNQKYLAPIQDALAVAESVAKVLRVSDSSYINMTSKICKIYDVDSSFLPEYIEQNPVSCLSKLLEDFNLTHLGTAHKLNLILEEHGILEKITRKSTKSQDKLKSFWSFTSKGLEWGKNEVYPPNPRETQPLYFREKFMSLLKQLQMI